MALNGIIRLAGVESVLSQAKKTLAATDEITIMIGLIGVSKPIIIINKVIKTGIIALGVSCLKKKKKNPNQELICEAPS